jgi:hypothetical protein
MATVNYVGMLINIAVKWKVVIFKIKEKKEQHEQKFFRS